MPIDPSFQFDVGTETERAVHFPDGGTGNFNNIKVDENSCLYRPILVIKPRCCKTFYFEFEVTAIQGSPTWAFFCPTISPCAYVNEGMPVATGIANLNDGPHEGFYAGITSANITSSSYSDAEGSLSASATNYGQTMSAQSPGNTISTHAWDMLNVSDYMGVLIDFNSVHGNTTCEMSVFQNGIHSYTAAIPVSNPDEDWTWGMGLGTNALSTDVDVTYLENKADWNIATVPKDAIPWKTPFETDSYTETGYCRMRPTHASQQEVRLATTLEDNSLTVRQKDTSTSTGAAIEAFGTVPRWSGKRYYEVTVNFTETAFSNPVWWMGLSSATNATAAAVTLPQPEHFAGLASNIGSGLYRSRFGLSDKLTNGQAAALRPIVATDVFMFAVEFLNQDAASDGDAAIAHVWYGKNGTWLSGDPATPTGHSDAIANQAYPAPRPFIRASTQTGTPGDKSWTFNFGGSTFAYTMPTGYSAWDASTVPSNGF